MDSLDAVRARIDELDASIIALIAQRQAAVVRAGELKPSGDAAAVRAPARVEQVVAKARARATESGASPDVVEQTYRAMIGAFIDLEHGVNSAER
nr:chorismate mutase [Arthrobacter sp. 35W]